jgi:Holliday junction resolvase
MTKNANYKSGYRAEHRAMLMLKREGYYPVRSAGSHGKFDVIGIGEKDFKLIQVKRVKFGSKLKFDEEIKAIRKTKVPENAIVELWVWEKIRGFHKYLILKNSRVKII